MVFVMVYAMICYNISLNIGGMANHVFLDAFHELVIMGTGCIHSGFLPLRKPLQEACIPHRKSGRG